ncbi:hypothetical protein O0I10_011842 [Lichtheimia ornata]|uniref:Uncharacterized protein n=1 Tax=Lichtheimia ornata TaxID=688661 RepID=A0AAD7US15_9FUNG|nr:uncharacterized protein O0I10_011842 [Lichtheimia ornata]KAJ8652518.1 hypothetical protein O0I10_011842 [Lichtheimia ornata]
MSTDCSPDSPSTTCRRRRGSSIQLLRTTHNDSCLPHKDTRELTQKRFMRWTACFGFVAKLKKSKHKLELPSLPESMIRRHSSAVPQSDRSCSTATTPSSRQSPARPMSQLVERHDPDSSLVTGFPWKDQTPPLLHHQNQQFPSPATPLSALSPPPRHAMKERSRSLTVDDTPPPWPSDSSIPIPKPRRKANTIGRSLALRLSLDVEQHYSSSIASNNSSSDCMKKQHDQEDGYSSACNTSEHSKHDTSSSNSTSTSSSSSSNSSSGSSSATTASSISPDHQQQRHKLRLSSIEAPPSPKLPEKRLSLKERRQRVSTVIPDIEKLTISVNDNDASATTSGAAYPEKHNEKEYDDDEDDDDDDDDDYDELLNEFQLPSEILPTMANKEKRSQEYHHHHQQQQQQQQQRRPSIPFPTSRISTDNSRQEAMDALEGTHRMDNTTPRPSMDIVRDKAYYDAVVAGTLHRRPWNQFLRAQSMIVGDNEGDFKETHQQHDQHYLSSPAIHHEKENRTRASSAIFNHRPSLVYFPPSPNSIESYYNS